MPASSFRPQSFFVGLLFIVATALIISSASAATSPVFLKYQSEYSTLHIWNGDCDPLNCNVSSPCEFNGELLQLNFTGGCTYQLVGASDSYPILQANASRLDAGVNVTFLIESGFDSWYTLNLYQYGVVFVFTSAPDGVAKVSMGGVGTIYMNPHYAANFSAAPAGLIIENINLDSLNFLYASTPYDQPDIPKGSQATMRLLVSGCNTIIPTSAASKPWFTLDTSASVPISTSWPVIASTMTFVDSTIGVNYESTAAPFVFVAPLTTSISGPPSTSTAVMMTNTHITGGKAKDLVRRKSDGVLAGTMTWTLIGSSITDMTLASLFSDASQGSTTFNAINSTVSVIPAVASGSNLTFVADGASSLTVSLAGSSLQGLDLSKVDLESTDSTITNCIMTVYGAQFTGHSSIQYNTSLTPVPSIDFSGKYSATFSNTMFKMKESGLDARVNLLTAGNPAVIITFSGSISMVMQSDSDLGCGIYIDYAMSLDPGTTVFTQCNLTLGSFVRTSDGDFSTIYAEHNEFIPSTRSTTPVVSTNGGLINTKLNLTGFAFAILHAADTDPFLPILAGYGDAGIIGYPYRGVSVDWGSNGFVPDEGVAYSAFISNMTLMDPTRSAPFTDAAVASSVSPLDVFVEPILDGSVLLWNVSFIRNPTPPDAIVPTTPIVAPSNPPSAPIASCPPPPPGFMCSGGKWVSNGTVNQPTTTFTVTTSSVVVNGNFTVESVVFTGTHQTVTVLGCITLNNNGTVSVDLSDEDPNTLSGKTISLLTQQGFNCSTSLSTVPVSITQPKHTCANVKSKSAPTSSHDTLALLFSVDRSSCNTKWIVLGSVLGAVVILGVVVTIVVYVVVTKMKHNESHQALKSG